MTIDGSILIGGESRRRAPGFHAIDPATGAPWGPAVSESLPGDVADACALAAAVADDFGATAPAARAAFLEAIADAIIAIGEPLIETAMAETGLPRARLEGERGRTTGQLRMFAAEVRRTDYLDVTIDPALPDRTPPRADLRRMNLAVGPVAVFGASNFPLAFSVAGGDTASAFAAGCPVVVKGHPAHPGTGEYVARAIAAAARACGLPAGVFSFLPGQSHDLGGALVADPRIKAVGFTGSRSGGLALVDIAARRAEPIPVYAEMSSINPVVLMPAALSARAEALATAYIASLTLGAGQFCTNPGVVIAVGGADLDRFIAAATSALAAAPAAVMLSPGIAAAYAQGVSSLTASPAAQPLAVGNGAPSRSTAALFETSATAFIADPALRHEVFGAASIIVRCASLAEVASVIGAMEGQLTATIHIDAADHEDAAALLPLLQARAGRLIANGWPTGVEVSPAMVHGGPFPATSDPRTTSVGTLAMMRFLRPVCYQDVPDPLLPPAMRRANPWQVARRIDGQREMA